MKKILKKLIQLKPFNLVYTYLYYGIQRRRHSLIINEYDAQCPLKGRLGEKGYISHIIPKESLDELINFRKNSDIFLTKSHADSLNKIFELFMEDIEDYLGSDVRIDVICVTEIDERVKKNVSQNWHTDNVGNRLKLFICIEGDGSYPTFYIPRSNHLKYSPSLIEDLRMVGRKNVEKLVDEEKLSHHTGLATIFDTNGLHRGGYELRGKMNFRRIIEIEFSNRYKSNKLMGKAAIGPRHYDGVFKFDSEFIKYFNYTKYLDENLVKKIDLNLYKYGSILN